MKNILIISPFFSPNIGGVETHLDDLIKYLTKKNYKICVITYQPLTAKLDYRSPFVEKTSNVIIYRLPWPAFGLFFRLAKWPVLEFIYLFLGIFVFGVVYSVIHNRKIDVIHGQGLVASIAALIIGKILSKKIVCSTHTDLAIYEMAKKILMYKLVKNSLSRVDKILVLSQNGKEIFTNMGLASEKIEVFNYWVDQTRFNVIDKKECRKQLVLENKNNLKVLFVGRFIAEKGIGLLLNVIPHLKRESICFLFAGDGPFSLAIDILSKTHDNIILLGHIDNRKIPIIYNAADILILPSFEEGFPRVILEALSCGLPVMASRRGYIPETLNSSVGLIIEPTEEEIINRLKYIDCHRDELARLSSNCRKYAEQRFSESNAKVIEKAYWSLK